ncbi:MAG: sugar transferase [Verrucomicrobiae bacterium]|nr:sugar transferase [Verrucomicrobiae bacterium]NNJ43998.1 sugar transferase [Akkermansiaceae bacterium]
MSSNDNTVTATEEKSGIGSIFDVGAEGSQGARHWKRAWVSKAYPWMLLGMDLLLISVIFSVAVWFRYDVDFLQALSRRIILVIMAGSLVGVGLIGGYSYQTNKSSFRFVSEHLIVSGGVFIGVFFVIYSVVTYGVPINSARSVIAFTLAVFPVCSIGYRFALSRIKRNFQRGNALCIIGSGDEAKDLCKRLGHKKTTLKIIVVDPDPSKVGKTFDVGDADAQVIEPLDVVSFNSSMDSRHVESYVVACPFSSLPEAFVKRLAAAQFSGNSVCTYESYLTEKLMIIPPSKISMDWVMNEGFKLNKRVTYDRVKRMNDILFSLLGMIVLSPVLLMTALAVKLTSKGPVIFKQTRVGEREVPFMIYKFRSMRVGSENGAKYTAANDSRLTPIGKFLRKSRLDELPQFWNVFKGDLSIIGPRAEWVELVESYEKKFPYYHFRHAIKPGITGWAQVNYSYGQNDEDTIEKFHYDLYYIRKYTPLLDVIIVVKTFYMVLFGRGQ